MLDGMAIYLIRHGETDSNARRILQTPDTPLSERGLEQAQRLACRLSESGIVRILASDLCRAAMTAEILQDATGHPLEFDAGLHERNFGDLRGTPYADLDADPFGPDYDPPGGESWETFHARVDAAWQRAVGVAAETAGDLAVVTHGLVCQSVVSRLAVLARDVEHPVGYGWVNTSVTILDPGQPWEVRLLNCAVHLEDAKPAGPA